MAVAKVDRLQKVATRCYQISFKEFYQGNVSPGQFVHLRLGSSTDPLLRRPFSVHDYHREEGMLWLLFQERGKFTRLMKNLQPGDQVDIMGPLGNGFKLDSPGKAILVAGGMGIAPLYFLARAAETRGQEYDLFLGGSTDRELPDEEYFTSLSTCPRWATEDGSRGYQGTIVELLGSYLSHPRNSGRASTVYACGPYAMLSRVVALASQKHLPVQVSLESIFACGTGACLGCVYPIKRGDQTLYLRVCKDGPVFSGEEVIFHE